MSVSKLNRQAEGLNAKVCHGKQISAFRYCVAVFLTEKSNRFLFLNTRRTHTHIFSRKMAAFPLRWCRQRPLQAPNLAIFEGANLSRLQTDFFAVLLQN